MSVLTPNGANKGANLGAARRKKDDEFYTQREDVDRELRHYIAHFKGKTVLCNCDDPSWSAFWQVFVEQFEFYGLKKLVSTHYANGQPSYKQEYFGRDKDVVTTPLVGDGDFRSDECVEILKEADIVVTNPPFSLFREYVVQLVEHGKQFLVIGNTNAITYKEVFPLIQSNRLWLGRPFANGNAFFAIPKDQVANYASGVYNPETGLVKFRNVVWFTNMPHRKRAEWLEPFRSYEEESALFPKYDNYDAIEVGRVQDIPKDYTGAMGVPITFLSVYNPEQFQILGITDRDNNSGLRTREYTAKDAPNHGDLNRRGALLIDGVYKSTYARLIIRHVPRCKKD